jgi:serine/threonine protein kinase
MELGEKSLYDAILNQNTYFDSENILRFAYNFTKLFAKFQSQQIVHRDIKPENFILFYSNTLDEYKEEKLEAKITDFGLCTNVI